MTLQEIRAFILLRQSSLPSEDKRKVITLTGGAVAADKVENAMRTLSTRILTSGMEAKKRVYPANYVDAEDHHDEAFVMEDEYCTMRTWSSPDGGARRRGRHFCHGV